MAQLKSRVLFVRVSTDLFKQLERESVKVGLKPSTFARMVLIERVHQPARNTMRDAGKVTQGVSV